MLYTSALHRSTPGLASLESGYFAATCNAIAELVVPYPRPSYSNAQDVNYPEVEQDRFTAKRCKAFHNILGLVMASLSSEAYIDATGSWIAMAYRLWLDHCPSTMDASLTQDWRGLFSGLQVRYNLDHASQIRSADFLLGN